MKNYTTLWISPIEEPHGVFIGTRGTGGPGGKPWPKVRARPRPYAYGAWGRALSRLSPVRCSSQFLVWALGFDESALQN